MFENLRDAISGVFFHGWPTVEGRITDAYVDPYRRRNSWVAYEFRIADENAPYTGQAAPPFWFDRRGVLNAINGESLVGQAVTIRYRLSDPCVNTIDWSFWAGLEL